MGRGMNGSRNAREGRYCGHDGAKAVRRRSALGITRVRSARARAVMRFRALKGAAARSYGRGAVAALVRAIQAAAVPPSITCPQCALTSYHPEDVKHRYCAKCGWHDDLGAA